MNAPAAQWFEPARQMPVPIVLNGGVDAWRRKARLDGKVGVLIHPHAEGGFVTTIAATFQRWGSHLSAIYWGHRMYVTPRPVRADDPLFAIRLGFCVVAAFVTVAVLRPDLEPICIVLPVGLMADMRKSFSSVPGIRTPFRATMAVAH